MIFFIQYGLQLELSPVKAVRASPLMYYVQFISVFGNFITHLVSHAEALLKGRYEIEILNKFREIDMIFATKLNHKINFSAIRKHILIETIATFFISIVLASFSVFVPVVNTEMYIRFLYIYEFTILRVRGFQIAFVMHFLSRCLSDMQILLKRQQLFLSSL